MVVTVRVGVGVRVGVSLYVFDASTTGDLRVISRLR